jgi:hypothetical protein
VTAFEFRLHPIGPNVMTAVVVLPIDRAREAAALYRELSRSAPDHMHVGLGIATASNGSPTVAVAAAHFGAPQDVESDLRGLLGQVKPLVETVTPTTYLALQTRGDQDMAWGKRFYMKGAFLDELSDAAVDAAAEQISVAEGECSITVWAMGGATNKVAEDAMAFTGRSAGHWVDADAVWSEKAQDEARIGWGRATMAALKPYARAGNYVNASVEQGDDVVRAIYGASKYDRLRALKRRHDPDNVFRLNQNIRP